MFNDECSLHFYWEDINKRLLTPDRELTTDKSNDTTKANFINHWMLLGILTGIWLKYYIHEHKWLEECCMTQSYHSVNGSLTGNMDVIKQFDDSWTCIRVSFCSCSSGLWYFQTAQFLWECLSPLTKLISSREWGVYWSFMKLLSFLLSVLD